MQERNEVLSIAKEPLVVNTMQIRLAKVATALTEASAHNDKAEVAWLMTATYSCEAFESVLDSGGTRFHGLDSTLVTALLSRTHRASCGGR